MGENASFWDDGNGTRDDGFFNRSSDGFLLLSEDIDQYYNHLNFSEEGVDFRQVQNCSYNDTNCTFHGGEGYSGGDYNYWALVLVLFPIFTLFGNVLVILSVYRERTLQTVTNYFIVSLALADLLVAVVVMPFAVYVLVSPKIQTRYFSILIAENLNYLSI